MMAKVIESKRRNKTLVIKNFKFFIGSVKKYQLILYIDTIYLTKGSYTIIYHFFFHIFISDHFLNKI
jgi:hypothetical protein